MKNNTTYFLYIIWILILGCSDTTTNSNLEEDSTSNTEKEDPSTLSDGKIKILSLGDSYTIGESVCETCNYPTQLKDSIISKDNSKVVDLKIIAKTGWGTTNLIEALEDENLKKEYDLITLLIGVNNLYQNRPFEVYTKEFQLLIGKAISLSEKNSSNIIVLSIPDYAFTPFGSGDTEISKNINTYNQFAENLCNNAGISYLNITDITRNGLKEPELVSNDGLHPSELAYTKFVEKLLPIAIRKIKQ